MVNGVIMSTLSPCQLDENIPKLKEGLNHIALSPVSFLKRAANLYPDKVAVVDEEYHYTYAEFFKRVKKFASALQINGLEKGDVVSFLAPNVTALLEAHFAVPMVGGILNAINVRLDADTITFILHHADSKFLFADVEFAELANEAIGKKVTFGNDEIEPKFILIKDDNFGQVSSSIQFDSDYESFIAEGKEFIDLQEINENEPLALNYTSGTTGNPKGVLYSHRGAYLNAVANVMSFGLDRSTKYLWTLPMFHCNGWTHTWAVTLAVGKHVCLRQVDPAKIYQLLEKESITHFSAAPIVLNMLIHAPEDIKVVPDQTVEVATGGAAPPSSVIAAMETLNCKVTHLYGLTETFGPCTRCEWQDDWNELNLEQRAQKMSRQGLPHHLLDEIRVINPDTLEYVPQDGCTIGELMVRSNTVMLGYFKNPAATEEAFEDGWFKTGDLAVCHSDGYIEIKDRSKDIIISGGENISTLEVEEVLYSHELVIEAAVVAQPDERWGETPCAFVTIKEGVKVSEEELIEWCANKMARFKRPRKIVFGDLPKTATGKIQKYILREIATKQAES
jgi:fatty-acyl-CoA synthase